MEWENKIINHMKIKKINERIILKYIIIEKCKAK
jgi:hypothetical protein